MESTSWPEPLPLMTPEPRVVVDLHSTVEKLCEDGLARMLRFAEQRLLKLSIQPGIASTADTKSFDPYTMHVQLQWHNEHSNLQTDLADRIVRGEFHLYGSKASASDQNPAVILTCTDVRRCILHPLENIIEVADETYKEVHAVLGPLEMVGGSEHRRLPLLQAISRWCDPWLLLGVRQNESAFRTDEIRDFGFSQLSVTSGPRRSARRRSAEEYAGLRRSLESSWVDLLKDMQTRVAAEEIYLYGVQTQPNLATNHERIPATWAFDLQIDAKSRSITAHGLRWTAVECWLDLADAGTEAVERAVTDPVPPAPRATLQPEDVTSLTDEAILILLEEHAKRVVEGPEAKLIAPGKISLLPIIKHKMEHRAAQGVLLPKLADEVEVLADWIASKVKSHPVPKALTIGKVLGKTYEALKARSTPAIQKPGY